MAGKGVAEGAPLTAELSISVGARKTSPQTDFTDFSSEDMPEETVKVADALIFH